MNLNLQLRLLNGPRAIVASRMANWTELYRKTTGLGGYVATRKCPHYVATLSLRLGITVSSSCYPVNAMTNLMVPLYVCPISQ